VRERERERERVKEVTSVIGSDVTDPNDDFLFAERLPFVGGGRGRRRRAVWTVWS
jgi:hypothetical protein